MLATTDRRAARQLAQKAVTDGAPLRWFEQLYAGSQRAVLLLKVLAQDREGRTAGRSGGVRPGPQLVRLPVVPGQFRELLPGPVGRHALKAADELGRSELGQLPLLGLREVAFDDYCDDEEPPVRRFRATFAR